MIANRVKFLVQINITRKATTLSVVQKETVYISSHAWFMVYACVASWPCKNTVFSLTFTAIIMHLLG